MAALVCLAIVVAGLFYAFQLGTKLVFADERDYLALADHLGGDGRFSIDGLHETASRPPAWAWFLAALRLVGLPVVLLRWANIVLFAACLYLLYRFARRAWSPSVGAAAVVLGAFYPVFFYTAGTLYPQMFAALLLLTIMLLLFDQAPPSWLRRAGAGVAAGVLVLTIPNLVLLLPLLFLMAPGSTRQRVSTCSLGLLATVLVVGAWTLQLRSTFDEWVFVSSNGGLNLLLGNSENTTPNAGYLVNIDRYRVAAGGLDEFEQDRFYRSAAVEWIRENKGDALALYGKKVVNYFNFRNELATESEASVLKDVLLAVGYGGLLLLALARVALRKRVGLRRIDAVLLTLYLASALVTAITYTRVRYRLPFDFLLVALVAPVVPAVLRRRVSPGGHAAVRA